MRFQHKYMCANANPPFPILQLLVPRRHERALRELNLNNVFAVLRDFMSEGSGLKDSSVDFVFLFNILHTENPVTLQKEAYRVSTPE